MVLEVSVWVLLLVFASFGFSLPELPSCLGLPVCSSLLLGTTLRKFGPF